MHYKKKRSGVQKELRRRDNKRHRQADRQAIGGKATRQIHDYSWSHRPQAALAPEVSPVKNKKKGKRTKKERCPDNPHKSAHEWVQDSWQSKAKRYWWRWRGQDTETVTEYHRICLHCGKEQWRTKFAGRYHRSPWRDTEQRESPFG